VAACGIGRPAAFARTLADTGADVRTLLPFPDHHDWTADDLRTLRLAAETHAADPVVTEKDAVKLAAREEACPPGTLVLGVDMALADEAPLRRVILDALRRADPSAEAPFLDTPPAGA
jgi:tetraacyldisaccharide 4'-kinase